MNARGTLASWATLVVCLSSAGLWGQPVPSKLSEEVKTLPDVAKPNEAGPVLALPVPGFDPVTNPAPVAMNRNEAATALIATTYSANWLSEGLSQIEREDLAQKGQRQTRSYEQRRGQADLMVQSNHQSRQMDFARQGADRMNTGNRFSTQDPAHALGGFASLGLAPGGAAQEGAALTGVSRSNRENRFEIPAKPLVNPYLESPAVQEPLVRTPAAPTTEPAKPVALPPNRPAPEPTPVVDTGKYFPQLKR